MSFSFYVYWKPNDVQNNYDLQKKDLEDYFGMKVSKCLNRVDVNSVSCDKRLLDTFVNKIDLREAQSWTDTENYIGCLINDINSDKLFPLDLEQTKEKSKNEIVSIFRMKGFMPTKVLEEILNKHARNIFEASEETKRIFIKLHGFYDSPVALKKLTESFNFSRIRVNEENFISMCCERDQNKSMVRYGIFNDFNRSFLISIN